LLHGLGRIEQRKTTAKGLAKPTVLLSGCSWRANAGALHKISKNALSMLWTARFWGSIGRFFKNGTGLTHYSKRRL
jgi:hypothetical protein